MSDPQPQQHPSSSQQTTDPVQPQTTQTVQQLPAVIGDEITGKIVISDFQVMIIRNYTSRSKTIYRVIDGPYNLIKDLMGNNGKIVTVRGIDKIDKNEFNRTLQLISIIRYGDAPPPVYTAPPEKRHHTVTGKIYTAGNDIYLISLPEAGSKVKFTIINDLNPNIRNVAIIELRKNNGRIATIECDIVKDNGNRKDIKLLRVVKVK